MYKHIWQYCVYFLCPWTRPNPFVLASQIVLLPGLHLLLMGTLGSGQIISIGGSLSERLMWLLVFCRSNIFPRTNIVCIIFFSNRRNQSRFYKKTKTNKTGSKHFGKLFFPLYKHQVIAPLIKQSFPGMLSQWLKARHLWNMKCNGVSMAPWRMYAFN